MIKAKSLVKYPIRKAYAIFLRAHNIDGFTVRPYEYIENAIEVEWNAGESFFASKNEIRIWSEDGKLEVLDIS